MKTILTEYEIATIGQELASANNVSDIDFARAIEAKIIERIGEAVAWVINENTLEVEFKKDADFAYKTPFYAIPFIEVEE